MKIKSKEVDLAEGDLTPMIDMTFQLIAFFMVLINFSQTETNDRVVLPSSQLVKPPEAPLEFPDHSARCAKDGEIILGGDSYSTETLAYRVAPRDLAFIRARKEENGGCQCHHPRSPRCQRPDRSKRSSEVAQDNEARTIRAACEGGSVMRIRREVEQEKNELNMTSMIDIVFLLLVFFIMTFKIVEQEGDFSIRMPLGGQGQSVDTITDLPLKLRLRADAQGRLAGMALNEIDLGNDFDKLRANVISFVGTEEPIPGEEGPEVEIDVDYNLRYSHVIRAITAVSGYRDESDQVVKLIEKIKFAKPRR